MLERHESNCAQDTECDKADDIETLEQDEAETFSINDHQAGFWS